MSKTFLDAGFLVACANRRDQHHECAQRLATVYERRPLVTTDAVILEVGNALAGEFRSLAVELIRHLLESRDIQVVHLEPSLLDKAFEFFCDYDDKTWGLVDCVSFVVMRELDIVDALTYDKHFVQAGFRALMREFPKA